MIIVIDSIKKKVLEQKNDIDKGIQTMVPLLLAAR